MKVLIDTSTMIAAMLSDHPHHAESQIWISQAKAGIFDFFASAHSVAEIYAVLTRLEREPEAKKDDPDAGGSG